MNKLKTVSRLILALLVLVALYSCDTTSKKGMDKFEGIWVHVNEKTPNDTLRVENLGNGNASIEFIAYSPKLSGNGFRKKTKRFSATYNPANERLDVINAEPVLFNSNTEKVSIMGEDWEKVE